MSDECDRCPVPGACCRFLLLPLARAFSADEQRWLALHPGVEYVEVDGVPHVKLGIACSQLDAAGLCRIVGQPERPDVCNNWPSGFDLARWLRRPVPDADMDRCEYISEARAFVGVPDEGSA